MSIQSSSPALAAAHNLSPGRLYVIRRDGALVDYDASKIQIAMTKAFLAVEGSQAADSKRIYAITQRLTLNISDVFQHRAPNGGILPIEDIQDQVELALMREGLHAIARAYVLYREERAQERRLAAQQQLIEQQNNPKIILPDGQMITLDPDYLMRIVQQACQGMSYPSVVLEELVAETMCNVFDGISLKDLLGATLMSARTRIEQEPCYSFIASQLLLFQFGHQALQHLQLISLSEHELDISLHYQQAFHAAIHHGIEQELLNPELASLFDLHTLAKAIQPNRDLGFRYLGLQTLYDRYLLHDQEIRYELPQVFFMRVAMGLCLLEKQPTQRAIEFYHLLSQFDFMSSTPTLFNSGCRRSQLSSCYVSTVPDDLSGIYDAIRDNALLSKYAGGLGNDWTYVRGLNAYIKGTNGRSQGVVPFLKVVNDTAVAVNQGGKRKGAVCTYLETWHRDIEDFLELRKNMGDDRRRAHDMNTANWIPDLFMKRVEAKQDWTLFSPDDVPGLHDAYGDAFEKLYKHYEQQAEAGLIKNTKTIAAQKLWRKMLSMLFETGHPWMTFKDPCNLRNPQQHVGVVHSSNLCTEIILNTSFDEIAVCNLGSINLARHLKDGEIDRQKLQQTIHTAIRMLDNVVDVNFYSVPQAERSNMRHRPIGIGMMGFQDALYELNIPYASEQAIAFADLSMELISYYAIEASCQIAQERGSYTSFDGSLWSQGILPIDSLSHLKKYRGDSVDQDTSSSLDWASLRQKVQQHGIRNSHVMAIAPTATIANICGVTQSIEPTYQNLYVKSNLSGEFTVINPHLVDALKQENLWDEVMINDLKYFDGSIQPIDRIPDHIKKLFATAFEIDAKWLIECASRRQKWIDQSQSLNLYIYEPNGKKLDQIYRFAWRKGLKTTYYLRGMGATSTEKSTVNDHVLNAVQPSNVPKVCQIDDETCESCQ